MSVFLLNFFPGTPDSRSLLPDTPMDPMDLNILEYFTTWIHQFYMCFTFSPWCGWWLMAVLAGGKCGFAAVAEQNWTVLVKLELVHVQIGSGQVMKSEPLSYPSIKRSHFLIGHHVLLWGGLDWVRKQGTRTDFHRNWNCRDTGCIARLSANIARLFWRSLGLAVCA